MPTSPWQSPRLHYRAVRTSDLPLFRALQADPSIYLASTHETTKLPHPRDAAEAVNPNHSHSHSSGDGESLLAAVIWLPHSAEKKAELAERKKGRGLATGGSSDRGSEDDKNTPENDSGTAIGQIHSAPTSLHAQCHRTMELALDILPAYQGKGYGSEAINWALEFGFKRAGLHSIRLRAFGWNTGAIRLYERLGFVMEGREREAVWYEGRWWDSLALGMLEEEWRAREAQGEAGNGER